MSKVTFSDTTGDTQKETRNKKPVFVDTASKTLRDSVRTEQKNSTIPAKSSRNCDRRNNIKALETKTTSSVKTRSEAEKATCSKSESPVKLETPAESSNRTSAKANDSKTSENVNVVKSSVTKKGDSGSLKRDVETPKVPPVLPQQTKKKPTEASKLRSIRKKPVAAQAQPLSPAKAVSYNFFYYPELVCHDWIIF